MKTTNGPDQFGRKLPVIATLGVIASVFAMAPPAVIAAEWRLEPLFSAGYKYDDNAVLAFSDSEKVEIHGYDFDAAAALVYATERTTFRLTPLLRFQRYNDSTFDSNERFANVDFNHEGLKSAFRFRGDYARESIRTAERLNADPGTVDPDEIPDDDSANVLSFGLRNRFRLAPDWRYNFTQKTAISLGINHVDVDYKEDLASHVPYTDSRVDASLTRAFSEKTRGFIKSSFRRYKRDPDLIATQLDIETVGVRVGFERDLSEKTRFRAEIGVEDSKPDQGASNSDVVGDIYLVKNLETVKLLAQYKRSVSASGNGFLVTRDSLNLSMTKQFSERVGGGLAVRGYKTDPSSVNAIAAIEREYAQFGADLTIALSRVIAMEFAYHYTYIDRTIVGEGAANANDLSLTFIYQPQPMSMSR